MDVLPVVCKQGVASSSLASSTRQNVPILIPVHQGGTVTFRPPQWAEHGREGSIPVPAGCPLLIVEGVGAGRREAAELIDTLIWVQSDEDETERRSLARVGTPGGPQSATNLYEWMAEEVPFIAGERTWERADLIICGTPDISYDPAVEVVVAAPSARSNKRGPTATRMRQRFLTNRSGASRTCGPGMPGREGLGQVPT